MGRIQILILKGVSPPFWSGFYAFARKHGGGAEGTGLHSNNKENSGKSRSINYN
jgi:hypothetical protein